MRPTIAGAVFAAAFMATTAFAQDTEVSIGMPSGVNFAVALIAQEKGFFAEEGIDIDLKPLPRGSLAIEAIAGGSLDFAEAAHTAFFAAASAGIPLVAVGVGSRGFTGKMIAAPQHEGLADFKDFTGKRIGIQVGTGVHQVLKQVLQANGLSEGDFEIANVRVTDMPTAMAAGGAFDAVIGWDPMMTRIIEAGNGVEAVSAAKFQELAGITYPIVLVTTKEHLENDPDTVRGVLNAYAKGQAYIKEHQDEAVEIYTAYAQTTGGGLDEDTIRIMMFEVDKFDGVTVSDADMADLDATRSALIETGQAPNIPELAEIVRAEMAVEADQAAAQ